MYVRREIKHGRKWGNKLSLSIGRFNSIDTAKKARVVRWNNGLDEDVRAGLVRLLAAPKVAKKRKVSEVSPADGDGVSSRTPQPLVEVSGNVPTKNTRGCRSKGGDATRPGATTSSPAPRQGAAAGPTTASPLAGSSSTDRTAPGVPSSPSAPEPEAAAGPTAASPSIHVSERMCPRAAQKRVRALTAEVTTLELSLRTLQESHEAR